MALVPLAASMARKGGRLFFGGFWLEKVRANGGRRGRPCASSILTLLLSAAFVVAFTYQSSAFVSSWSSHLNLDLLHPSSRMRLSNTALNALAPGSYKSLAKVRVRSDPDASSAPTGQMVDAGQVVEVTEIAASGDQTFLKLADGGWIFEKGIAGAWSGKSIVEMVSAAPAPAPVVSEPMPSTPEVEVVTEVVSEAPKATDAVVSDGGSLVLPVATVPVETLRWPAGASLGAGFEFVRLEAEGNRVLTFLLASGFPKNVITSVGKELLGDLVPAAQFKGGWMSQSKEAAAATIDLENVKFAGTGAVMGDLKGCEVMDILQAQLATQFGVQVHGVLGLPFFQQFDMDLERYQGRVNFYEPGDSGAQGFYSSVRHLPGIALPSGMLGIVVKSKAAFRDLEDNPEEEVALVGALDTGSAHSIINWKAAELLGLAGPDDTRLQAASKVICAGSDGRLVEMPVVQARFSLCGAPEEGVTPMLHGLSKAEFDKSGEKGKGWYLNIPTNKLGTCLQLGAINVAIGDALSLTQLGDSSVGDFTGAAAILGQDILFQGQRVVINYRDKNVFMEPGDVADAPAL